MKCIHSKSSSNKIIIRRRRKRKRKKKEKKKKKKINININNNNDNITFLPVKCIFKMYSVWENYTVYIDYNTSSCTVISED